MQAIKRLSLWARLALYCAVSSTIVMLLVYKAVLPLAMETKVATYTVTVTDKLYTGGRTLYLVFAEDSSGKPFVFENRDALFRGKFNSSDVQEIIRVGETYEFTAVGYRIFYFSGWYPNIVDVQRVDTAGGAT